MTAIMSQHTRLLVEMISEYRKAVEDALLAGVPEDYAAYRQLVGQLQGANDALRLSGQADYKLSGEE